MGHWDHGIRQNPVLVPSTGRRKVLSKDPQALESLAVNLAPGTYYFALRTRDEAGNESGLSNASTIVVP